MLTCNDLCWSKERSYVAQLPVVAPIACLCIEGGQQAMKQLHEEGDKNSLDRNGVRGADSLRLAPDPVTIQSGANWIRKGKP